MNWIDSSNREFGASVDNIVCINYDKAKFWAIIISNGKNITNFFNDSGAITKLLTIVLHRSYIRDLLTPYVPSRQLLSSSKNLLVIPNYYLKTYGAVFFFRKSPCILEYFDVWYSEQLLSDRLKTNLKRCFFKKFYNFTISLPLLSAFEI